MDNIVKMPKGEEFEPELQVKKAKGKTGAVSPEKIIKNIM